MAIWLREGDNNALANSHRRNNSTESLVVNGNTRFASIAIKEHIVNFYKQLYSEQYIWRTKLDGLSFLSIYVEEREFEESEVLEVTRNLNGDKALGLVEFSMAFFQ